MGRFIRSMGANAAMQGARAAVKAAVKHSLPAVAAITMANTKQIKKIQQKGPELKYFDTSPSALQPDFGPTQNSLNLTLVTQGVGNTQRLGGEVRLKNIEIGYIINQTYGHTGPCGMRVIVVQDKARDTVSVAPTAGQILELGTLGAVGDVIIAPYSKDMPNRFRIVYDRIHNLGIFNTLGATAPLQVNVRKTVRIPLKYNKVTWDETGNAQGDLRGNCLYVLVVANSSGDSLDPSYNPYFRINFWDN